MPTTSTTPASTAIVSVKPVVLAAPDRGDDLQVRVSAPAVGADLPVLVFAHGFGQSMRSHDPLVDFWASHGFVVLQPTFLDSATYGLAPTDPRYPDIWRTRVSDVHQVLDSLDQLLEAVPGLRERVDPSRIAVGGHSWGGQTVGMLLGARVIGADGEPGASELDPRITAGVLLATTGLGGEDLTPFAQQHFAFMSPDFTGLTIPTLVVAGDHDQSLLSTRGPDWFTDVFTLSPGAEALLTTFGGEHSLGGIHAYTSTDTTDESPERVDLIARFSWAFLRKALGIDDGDWAQQTAALAAAPDPIARLDTK